MLKQLLFSCLFASATVVAHGQQATLSAHTRLYLHKVAQHPGDFVPLDGFVYKSIAGQPFVSTLIKVNGTVSESALTALGAHVGTKAGTVWTVQVPYSNVEALSHVAGISHIDMDLPVIPCLDNARKTTKADSAQLGIGLPLPVTGKNVVVGIIDAGFDYDHPTLYDTAHTQYRVRRVWAQKNTGTPPIGYTYGREFTDPYVMRAWGYDTGITTHGTHVAGIAAGSGYGSAGNNRYRGMAYESDLVFVGIMPAPGQWAAGGSTDILDGMNYIYNYAASVYKPCIVNLSWGSSIGPHDGHSLFSQACDALTGPGRIFAASAGNNGGDTIHLQKTFTATDNSVSTFVTFSDQLDSANQKTWIDVWGDTAQSFCLSLKLYNGTALVDSTIPICIADTLQSYVLTGSDAHPLYVTISMTANEYNGKPHAFVSLHSLSSDNICLTATGTSGTIHMWEGYIHPPVGYYGALKKLGYPWAVSGDTKATVSDISASYSAISVGAYVSKASFRNIGGVNLSYPGAVNGRIAPFSSLGPLPDGRTKPDITGPGMALASAISSYDTSYAVGGDNRIAVISESSMGGRTYPYAMAAGTSMSSPATSGIIAMLLQMDATLTPDSVKSILRLTAITDANTGTIPAAGSNTWGYGKVNAYKALRHMAAQVSVKNEISDDITDCLVYPNPSDGNYTILFHNTGRYKSADIQVLDITGKVVYSAAHALGDNYTQIQVTLPALPHGVYFTCITCGGKSNVIRTLLNR